MQQISNMLSVLIFHTIIWIPQITPCNYMVLCHYFCLCFRAVCNRWKPFIYSGEDQESTKMALQIIFKQTQDWTPSRENREKKKHMEIRPQVRTTLPKVVAQPREEGDVLLLFLMTTWFCKQTGKYLSLNECTAKWNHYFSLNASTTEISVN